MLEKLAAIQHDIWSHWMQWMFSQGTHNDDGSWTMPQDLVDRWERQMSTDFADLSNREQQSDREVVVEFMKDIF